MRTCILLAALFWVGTPAPAQEWARRMFDHTEFDFGTVARGAKAEHRFPLENIYREDVHILSITSTCGCTKPTITKDLLPSLAKGEIVATLDTRSFIGHKEAAIKVKFDQPFPAEVILKVSCYIRSDVVVQPGVIDFGTVPQGAPLERVASVDYAGRRDWQVVAVEVSNPHLDVEMVENARNEGQVNYRLSVKLKPDTPAGYFKDQLVLVTNDTNPRTARVPVPIEASVAPSLTLRPSPLNLGVVSAGQTVTKHLVAQSQTPFRIASVRCADPRFRFEVSREAKSLHLIPVTFAADNRAGNLSEVIHVQTESDAAAGMDVNVLVRVVDANTGTLPGLPAWMPPPGNEKGAAGGAADNRPSPVKEPAKESAKEPAKADDPPGAKPEKVKTQPLVPVDKASSRRPL